MLALSRPVHIKNSTSARYRSPHVCGDVISNHEIKNSAKGYSIVSNAAQSATKETDPLAKVYQRNLLREPFKHQFGWSIDNIVQPYVFKAEVVDPVPQYSWKSNVFQTQIGLTKHDKFLPRGGMAPRVVDSGGDDGYPYLPPDLDSEGRAITHDSTGAALTIPNGGTSGGLGSKRAPVFSEKGVNNQNNELKKIRQILEGSSLNNGIVRNASTPTPNPPPPGGSGPRGSGPRPPPPTRPLPPPPPYSGGDSSGNNSPFYDAMSDQGDDFTHGLADLYSGETYLTPDQATSFTLTHPDAPSPLTRIPIFPLKPRKPPILRPPPVIPPYRRHRGYGPPPSSGSSSASSSSVITSNSQSPAEVALPPAPGQVIPSSTHPLPDGSLDDLLNLSTEIRTLKLADSPTPSPPPSNSPTDPTPPPPPTGIPISDVDDSSPMSEVSTPDSNPEALMQARVVHTAIVNAYEFWLAGLPSTTSRELHIHNSNNPEAMLRTMMHSRFPPIAIDRGVVNAEGTTRVFLPIVPIDYGTDASPEHAQFTATFRTQNPTNNIPSRYDLAIMRDDFITYLEYNTDESFSYMVPYIRRGPLLIRAPGEPIHETINWFNPNIDPFTATVPGTEAGPVQLHSPPVIVDATKSMANASRFYPTPSPSVSPPPQQRPSRPNRTIPTPPRNNIPSLRALASHALHTRNRSNSVHIAVGGYFLPWQSVLAISGPPARATLNLNDSNPENRSIIKGNKRLTEEDPRLYLQGYRARQRTQRTRQQSGGGPGPSTLSEREANQNAREAVKRNRRNKKFPTYRGN